jgi:type IV pilus assembly protein PilB
MRLGEILARAGVVTELQLNAALGEQRQWGGRLGQILIRMGVIDETTLVFALGRQLQVPVADLTAAPSEALRARLDAASAARLRVLPLSYVAERRTVRVAMADPTDVVTIDDLARRFGAPIEPLIAGEQALQDAIRAAYSPGANHAPDGALDGRVARFAATVHAVRDLLSQRGIR